MLTLTRNFAKKTNSKVKKVLNQRDMIADEARNYEDKFDLANSNAQKEIAAVNELKKTPSWQMEEVCIRQTDQHQKVYGRTQLESCC